MNINTPDFFSIGPSKTGTSWQLHHFCRHPQIRYPIIKDLNFFDEADLYSFIQSKYLDKKVSGTYGNYFDMYDGTNLTNFEHVLALRKAQQDLNFRSLVNLKSLSQLKFSQLLYGIRFRLLNRDLRPVDLKRYCDWLFKKEEGKIAGDLSTQYFKLSSPTIALIAKTFPKLKIIVGIRNPIERRWSYLRMVSKSNNNGSDVAIANTATAKLPDLDGDYKSAISNWSKYFPKEQIYFAFFDQLHSDPVAYLKGIYDFLGIRFSKEMVDPTFRNKGRESDIPNEIYEILRERSVEQIKFLNTYFPNNPYIRNWKML